MNYSLGSLVFLERSLVFPILLFSSISLHCSLRNAFLSLLAILWNSVFRWVYLSYLRNHKLFHLSFRWPPKTCLLWSSHLKLVFHRTFYHQHSTYLFAYCFSPPYGLETPLVNCYTPSLFKSYVYKRLSTKLLWGYFPPHNHPKGFYLE